MIKRIADWLEKMSAGSMLVGMFQNSTYAIAVGLVSISICLYITRRYLK